jgi:5-deoxy-glucuronate isomerase
MSSNDTLLIRDPIRDGNNEIVGPGRMGLLQFSILRLNEGETEIVEMTDREIALVILTGTATIAVDSERYEGIGGRKDVFSANPATVYVPAGSGAVVECAGPGPVQVAVCSAPSTLKRAPALIAPADVKVKTVGRTNWTRHVKDIIDVSFEAQHLVLGETLNPPGNWSSSPPHRHDIDNPPHEVNMEEIYFYQSKPTQGFGFQRIYTDDRSLDVSYCVEHNDTVMIPEGYHPVAAAPGYQIYYLWFLAGPTSRVLMPSDDPAHAWLKDVEPVIDNL